MLSFRRTIQIMQHEFDIRALKKQHSTIMFDCCNYIKVAKSDNKSVQQRAHASLSCSSHIVLH